MTNGNDGNPPDHTDEPQGGDPHSRSESPWSVEHYGFGGEAVLALHGLHGRHARHGRHGKADRMALGILAGCTTVGLWLGLTAPSQSPVAPVAPVVAAAVVNTVVPGGG